MDKQQIFLHQKIYPNAFEVFNIEVKPLQEIIKDCLFIIDTNVLLLPYTTSTSGFHEIKKVYSKLIENQQLFIPGQVAREFAKNRPEKIKTLFQQLSVSISKIQQPKTGQYPLLESLDEYKEAIELEKQIQESVKNYSRKIKDLLEQVKNWRWNDPVSAVYKELFKSEIVIELDQTEENILTELELRNKFNIPPGFNDKSKEDHGVGDLIIWLTILQLAKEHNKAVIFVSGDEKNDWFYRSENQSLYPRFELLTEFKNKTSQTSFHIIKLSQLLTTLGAKEDVVQEVEIQEIDVNKIYSNFDKESIVLNWLLENEYFDEISVSNTYPDFTATTSGRIEGIEVITKGISPIPLILTKFSKSFKRACKEINDGNFYKMTIFVVMQTFEEIDYFIKFLSQKSDLFNHHLIRILPGIIEHDRFVPVA